MRGAWVVVRMTRRGKQYLNPNRMFGRLGMAKIFFFGRMKPGGKLPGDTIRKK